MKNELSKLTDEELAESMGQCGDPFYFEGLKAEQNRRALIPARKANAIALAAVVIAGLSLLVSIFALLK